MRLLILFLLTVPVSSTPAAVEPAASDSTINVDYEETTVRLSPGLVHTHLSSARTDSLAPINIHVLTASLDSVRLRPALALDQVVGQETVASIVYRHGAVAGTNSGFSYSNDPWNRMHGDPRGLLVIDGDVVSEPNAGAWAVGFSAEGVQRPFVCRPGLRIEVRVGDRVIAATGVNRGREDRDIIVFTPAWGRGTIVDTTGVEAVVAGGRLVDVRNRRGGARIPADGFVVSAGPDRADAISGLSPGLRATLSFELVSMEDTTRALPIRGHHYVSAGPLLALDGRPVDAYDATDHWFTKPPFTDRRHPRTGIGISADARTVYLVTVDGRQPDVSVGHTLAEFRDFILGLGAVHVYNLDGGGSTTMAVRGRAVNRFSDVWGGYLGDKPRERRRCEALLLFPAP